MLRLRIGALIAAGAIAFAACSGASTAAPSVAQPSTPAASSGSGASTAPSTAPSGPTPVNGGTWIFGSASDPSTLDAILIQDGESFRIAQQIYETLIKLKPGSASDLQPDLAKSWDTSTDGLTYTFHLQTGVNFSDGTPFNADAAVYNVNRWKNLPAALQGDDYYDVTVFGGYGDNSLIKTVDEDRRRDVLDHPDQAEGRLPDGDDPHPVRDAEPDGPPGPSCRPGLEGPDERLLAEGPDGHRSVHVRRRFRPGRPLHDRQEPELLGYRQRGAPRQDHLPADRRLGEPADGPPVRARSTRSTSSTRPSSRTSAATRACSCMTRPPLDIGKLAFNQTQKPFNDIKVREAVALAIDKKALVERLLPERRRRRRRLRPDQQHAGL